jgi:hypothetical protein
MKWRMWVSKKFRVALVLITGRYALILRSVPGIILMMLLIRCRFLAAPYAVPLTAVVGAPIPVTKVLPQFPHNGHFVLTSSCRMHKTENPSVEDVEALHSRYLAELSALFEKHKAAHGYADRTLHIE